MSLTRRELWSWMVPRRADPAPAAEPLAWTPGAPVAAPPIPPTLAPRIVAASCLATTSFCSVCRERCPRPGAIVVDGRTPRIVDAACDGCGRCVATCPAPTLAIALGPRRGAAS